MAVRLAAKKLIAEIDRDHDPRQTEFHADFHLERWRVEPFSAPGQVWAHMRHGRPIYKYADTVVRK